jgi:GNAT superfamily N-acetyltransferase
MGIELRPATEDDLDTLNGMVRAYYVYDELAYEELPARRALQEIIRSEHFGRAWLVDLDKELIGYAVLTFGFSVEFHGRHAVLDEIFLLPDHRGKGHFKEILALIEACCRQLRIRGLSLLVETKNEPAQRAYQKNGFKPYDRIVMTKRLT